MFGSILGAAGMGRRNTGPMKPRPMGRPQMPLSMPVNRPAMPRQAPPPMPMPRPSPQPQGNAYGVYGGGPGVGQRMPEWGGMQRTPMAPPQKPMGMPDPRFNKDMYMNNMIQNELKARGGNTGITGGMF